MNEISNKWIGKNTVRPDGAEKVTGRAQYSSDTTMPGMIWGHVLRSPHPHAKIISINTKNTDDYCIKIFSNYVPEESVKRKR